MMSKGKGNGLVSLFVYLEEQPLLWLFVTMAVYLVALQLQSMHRYLSLLNPVLLSASFVALILWVADTAYEDYFAGAQFIHVMLGPAIVGLAVFVKRHLSALWRARYAVLAALICGALVTALSAILMAQALNLSAELTASIAPKSVTAPIAMGIANELGGLTSLAAVLAVVTGITGAVLVTPLFTALGLKDWRARGFAVGLNCHGIGVAHAFQIHPIAGTFATLGMALNGVFSSVVLPALFMILI